MTTPTVGNDIKVWVTPEATFDTSLAIAATDAIGVLDCEIKPFLEYHPSKEHVGTASLQTEIQGKRGGTWKITCYVKSKGSGTQPNSGELFKAGMGSESGSNYSFAAVAPTSIQIAKYSGSGLYQQANGCWVEKIEAEYKGNEECMLTFSGGFASYGWCYDGVLTTAAGFAGGATSIALTSGQGPRIGGALRIKFATEDNSGSGYLISTPAADTLTISPGLANALSAATKAVAPVLPSFTLGTEQIAGGIACGLSIGGTSIGAISAKVSIDTGIHGLAKEATSNRPNRLSRGERKIELSMECYYLEENNNAIGSAWRGTTQAIVLRFGEDTTGYRMVVTAPAARINVTSPDEAEHEEATVSMTAVPRQSSAAEDELTINFT
ncbi:MAG: hypothetical protein RL139_896 [Gemmatimonadota bacterium]